MTSTAKTSPRERLIHAATELFYREGIAASGVEKLCQTAGVSKRSMYQLFDTKDELLVEVLTRLGPVTFAMFLPDDADRLTPRQRIRHVFERLEQLAATGEYAGCPWVNTATELRDPTHPASAVALSHKQRMTDYFAEQAKLAGLADPEGLAAQLTVVFDGISARVLMRPGDLDGLAVRTAEALLDAGGPATGGPG